MILATLCPRLFMNMNMNIDVCIYMHSIIQTITNIIRPFNMCKYKSEKYYKKKKYKSEKKRPPLIFLYPFGGTFN